jgi:hypothetical protein
MCFSSQYYMMSFIHVAGMLFLILAVEIMMRVNYNCFGDPATVVLVPTLILIMWLLKWLLVSTANRIGIWKVQETGSDWADDPSAETWGLPSMKELMEQERQRQKGKGYNAWLMNQKLAQETFRYKFLDYNRAWLVANLPNMLTPRTIQRSRPYLIAQFGRMLGLLEDDLGASSDEDDDASQRFKPVDLSASGRAIIRWWLGKARRRIQYRESVQGLIKAAIIAEEQRHPQPVDVEMKHTVEELADKFEESAPEMVEVDLASWKTFFKQNQRYRAVPKGTAQNDAAEAISSELQSEQKTDGFGPIFLSAASKAIMLMWYRKGRTSLRRRAPSWMAKSSRESDEDEPPPRASQWKATVVSASTRAIAIKWLQLGRYELAKRKL